MQIKLVLADGTAVGEMWESLVLPPVGLVIEVLDGAAGKLLYTVAESPAKFVAMQTGFPVRNQLVPFVVVALAGQVAAEDPDRDRVRFDAGVDVDTAQGQGPVDPAIRAAATSNKLGGRGRKR